MKDLRQTKEYSNYMGNIGWNVDLINSTYIYTKKLPILGSLVKIQRSESIVSYRDISKIVEKYKCYSVFIEPKTEKQSESYKKFGFKNSKDISLPSKTILINLSHSEEKLLSKMHSKTRYNIGLVQRKGIKIVETKDINLFAELWQKNANERGQFLPQKKEITEIYKSFINKSKIFLALLKEEVLAGILILETPEINYYMYVFSNKKGKKLFAPTLIAWHSILYSKKVGKKYFDFEGIFDERFPLKAWSGFTRFKKSFGGEEVEFPGPLTKTFIKERVKKGIIGRLSQVLAR